MALVRYIMIPLRVFLVEAVEVLEILLRQFQNYLVFLVYAVLSLVRHILPIRLTVNEDGIDGD